MGTTATATATPFVSRPTPLCRRCGRSRGSRGTVSNRAPTLPGPGDPKGRTRVARMVGSSPASGAVGFDEGHRPPPHARSVPDSLVDDRSFRWFLTRRGLSRSGYGGACAEVRGERKRLRGPTFLCFESILEPATGPLTTALSSWWWRFAGRPV